MLSIKKGTYSLIFVFLLLLLSFFDLNSLAFASDVSCKFDSEEECQMWSGGVFDESIAYDGSGGFFVSNPFGEVKNSLVTHVLEYSDTIHLESEKIYTISGYILNPASDYFPSPRTHCFLGDASNTVIISVSGTGSDWSEFSTTFYASETGDFNLAFHLEKGAEDFGFFIDEISFEETECRLSELKIEGQSNILIPQKGSMVFNYTPFLYDKNGNEISVLSERALSANATAEVGTSFNPSDMTLTVSSDAVSGTDIQISCSLPSSSAVSPCYFTVTLTDNLLSNSDFEADLSFEWTSSSPITLESDSSGNYISIQTNDYGKYGYFTTLTYNSPVVLVEDSLYVLHARIKSDVSEVASSVHALTSSNSDGASLCFNIADISGSEWVDVSAAYIPSASGIYDISISFYSPFECTLFIDDIRLCSEVLKPTYITLHAPGNIALSSVVTEFPVSAYIRDQIGNVIEDEECNISFLNLNNSFEFNEISKTISVHPDAYPGEYTMIATSVNYPELSKSHTLTVSSDYVGDGSFEEKLVNEWWMAASPYESFFSILDDGDRKYANIECSGDYFILYNNSYMHLFEDIPYVFNASFTASTDVTATAFIETIYGETVPLMQTHILQGMSLSDAINPELLLADYDAVGRLLLYFQSDNGEPFSVECDNISLKKAIIKALNLNIVGDLSVNGAAKAEFLLYNNITENSSSSDCAFSWYVSDAPYGEYTQLSVGSRYIYFDTTFADKYVYFEMTPICPVTGFSGETVKSAPVYISSASNEENIEDSPIYPPLDSDNEAEDESKVFSPININEYVYTESTFDDISNHWAQENITVLSAFDVVNGKTPNRFFPDDNITRAEASKLFSLACGINSSFNGTLHFDDVNENDWFCSYVYELYNLKIINGTSETTFSPHKNITREELAAIAVRIYEAITKTEVTSSSHIFNDSNIISIWAKDYVQKAVSLHLIEGTPENCFLPTSFCTRAEATSIIFRLLEVLNQ